MMQATSVKRVVVGVAAIAVVFSASAGSAQAADNSPLVLTGVDVTTTQQPIDWGELFTPGDISDDLSPDTTGDYESPPQTAAGSHPAVNIAADFCAADETLCPVPDEIDDAKDLHIDLPPGLLGNLRAASVCDVAAHMEEQSPCPGASAVGYAFNKLWASFRQLPPQTVPTTAYGYVFSDVPREGEAARLSGVITVQGATEQFYIPSMVTLRTDGDYGVSADIKELPRQSIFPEGRVFAKLANLEISLFPDAASAVPSSEGFFALDPSRPFMTMPTNCDAGTFGVIFNSWEHPETYLSAFDSLQATDCDQVPFDPSVSIATDTAQPGKPAGYKIGIGFPDSEADPIHQAHLKRAEVALPPGVVLSPGAAEGLEGCSDEQFGRGNKQPVQCPDASQIGTVDVETPILDPDPSTPALDSLHGKVFFGKPTATERWPLRLLIEGPGLRIKLSGAASINESTGEINNIFTNLPQTPFTKFDLTLNGGDHAILTNPRSCGTSQISAKLTPWSGGPDENVSGNLITAGTCPASPRPFAPTVSASVSPTDAGAHSSSHIEVANAEGNQLLKKLVFKLPPGAVGKLSSVPLCSKPDAVAGNCDLGSRIGKVAVTTGSGNTPLTLSGTIYLTDPLESGDAAGISIVVPAKVGPIDLGNVVLTSRALLRQSDAGIDVVADNIPTIYKGVPQVIRKISIDVDRKGFWINGTNCDSHDVLAEFSGDEGATATSSSAGAASNCGDLPFNPKLRLIAEASGQTARFQHTGLRAIVTQQPGQANIAGARVVLPSILRPDNQPFFKPGGLCHPEELALNACPAASQVGNAVATTPLLSQPLNGPVYVVQDASNPLPRLAVMLNGQVALELDASNHIEGVRTVNTFASVPDVPVSRFELFIKGGSNGILKNFQDLCQNPDKADATFKGHSGKTSAFRPPLEVKGCGVAVRSSSVRVSKGGSVSVSVQCGGEQACNGSIALRGSTSTSASKRRAAKLLGSAPFSIPSGKTQKVKIKLTKQARRAVAKRKRLKASAVLDLRAVKATTTAIRLVAAKAKKKHKR